MEASAVEAEFIILVLASGRTFASAWVVPVDGSGLCTSR